MYYINNYNIQLEKKKLSNMGQDRQKSSKPTNNSDNNYEDTSNNLETNNNIITEEIILSKLNNIIEIEAISTVYKMQIQGIKKCENILKYTISSESDHIFTVTTNHSDMNHHTTMNEIIVPSIIELNENITINNNNNNSDTNCIIPTTISSDENIETISSSVPIKTMSEYEITRLTAIFILYGAPLQYKIIHNDLIKSLLKTIYGIDSNSIEENIPVYNWNDVLKLSKINKTKEEVEDFYYLIWIPFCNSISNKRKNLSYSQNKYVVPNPYLTINDHHYAARGLCQLFLIRQQLLYAACYVLNENLDELLDYLKNNI